MPGCLLSAALAEQEVVVDADDFQEDVLEFGAESGGVAFKVRLAGASVDVEEGLQFQPVSEGAREGEEHGDAGGAFEFQAAVLISTDQNFVVDEFDGGAECFAAEREVLLLLALEADPAFELADGLFQLGAEFDREIDGA